MKKRFAIYAGIMGNNVRYKYFADYTEARHWVINTLDMSKDWTIVESPIRGLHADTPGVTDLEEDRFRI
jgi:hypothetical protein